MKTICWDCDDVLNNFTKDFLKHESLGLNAIKSPTYGKALDYYREVYYSGLNPNIEVLNWFRKYGHLFNHHVITAIPLKFAQVSSGWVFTYFGKWIRNYHIIPSLRMEDSTYIYDNNSKADLIQRLGNIDYFIDDSGNNIMQTNDLDIDTVCFLVRQPWNDSDLSMTDILEKITEREEGLINAGKTELQKMFTGDIQ